MTIRNLKRSTSDYDDEQNPNKKFKFDETTTDRLFKETAILYQDFPDVDSNKIYTSLEANYANQNRVEFVRKILLSSFVATPSGTCFDDSKLNSTNKEFKELTIMFPKADPDFLLSTLTGITGKDRLIEAINHILDIGFENQNLFNTQAVINGTQSDCSKTYTIKEFYEKFPQPEEVFVNNRKLCTNSYKQHALVYLANSFRKISIIFISTFFRRHEYQLIPTIIELRKFGGIVFTVINNLLMVVESAAAPYLKKHYKDKQTLFHRPTVYPEKLDEFFYNELFYIEHRTEIYNYIEQRKLEIIEAKENNDLFSCPCCLNEDILSEDMKWCDEGHLFCKFCINKSIVIGIGEGKTKFSCLSGIDNCFYSLPTLKTVLTEERYKILLQKIQQEAIMKADLENLVSCPFCPYFAIIPDKRYTIFTCLNSFCMKESCRLCKKESHIPFRCDEVNEMDRLRKNIENKMSEAIVRKCVNCKTPFIKNGGCTHITCPKCKSEMCYICRKLVKDHETVFLCDQILDDDDEMHKKESIDAGNKIKTDYLENDSNMKKRIADQVNVENYA